MLVYTQEVTRESDDRAIEAIHENRTLVWPSENIEKFPREFIPGEKTPLDDRTQQLFVKKASFLACPRSEKVSS